jgi:hypothetical protein
MIRHKVADGGASAFQFRLVGQVNDENVYLVLIG